MNRLNLFYRAFKEYREAMQDERESKLLRNEIVKDHSCDKVISIKSTCEIDEDWIKAIEQGLEYIGKAIKEDRQFIRTEGTIDPIEKVRHVSRETVEHLARHSDFITHEPKEDGDLMPDKLYTVERLTNYAVYENRFLYMVLCDLDQFVSYRYNRIIQEANSYRGELSLSKSVKAGKRCLDYKIEMQEKSEDDPLLSEESGTGELIQRIEQMQRMIYYYLHTPLILEVAKADKLKPPIVKTNVLRMNKNFKEVVVLYEFLVAYQKDGFTIIRQEHTVDFEKGDVANEFAEPALLLSFLAYEYGMDIGGRLKDEYEQEEVQKRKAEADAFQKQLKIDRAKLQADELPLEKYIELLEKRNVDLESREKEIVLAQEKVAELKKETAALEEQLDTCRKEHDEEIVRLQEQAEETRQKLEADYQAEVEKRDGEIESLREQFREEKGAHTEEIEQLTKQNSEALSQMSQSLEMSDNQCKTLQQKLEESEKQRAIVSARLTALRKEHGLITDAEDFTSEEAFSELEHELEVFFGFVRGEWKSAKKLLRREMFGAWRRSLKNQRKGSVTTATGKTTKAKTDIAKDGDKDEKDEKQ